MVYGGIESLALVLGASGMVNSPQAVLLLNAWMGPSDFVQESSLTSIFLQVESGLSKQAPYLLFQPILMLHAKP